MQVQTGPTSGGPSCRRQPGAPWTSASARPHPHRPRQSNPARGPPARPALPTHPSPGLNKWKKGGSKRYGGYARRVNERGGRPLRLRTCGASQPARPSIKPHLPPRRTPRRTRCRRRPLMPATRPRCSPPPHSRRRRRCSGHAQEVANVRAASNVQSAVNIMAGKPSRRSCHHHADGPGGKVRLLFAILVFAVALLRILVLTGIAWQTRQTSNVFNPPPALLLCCRN